MQDTIPRTFFSCGVDDCKNLFVATYDQLIRCKLDGTDAKVIAAGPRFQLPVPTMSECNGFCIYKNTLFMIGPSAIKKLYLVQHWNQKEHHYFPKETRRAIELVIMAASSLSNKTIFSKLPRELVPLILSFIPF
jgi:hypothetical protein